MIQRIPRIATLALCLCVGVVACLMVQDPSSELSEKRPGETESVSSGDPSERAADASGPEPHPATAAPAAQLEASVTIECKWPTPAPCPTLQVTLVAEPSRLEPPEAQATVLERNQSTDPSGLARFVELAPGGYRLIIEGEEIPPLTSARPLFLYAGAEKRLSIDIGPFDLTLTGDLVDGNGAGIAGIRLDAQRNRDALGEDDMVLMEESTLTAESDVDGTFAFTGLLPGDYTVSTPETRNYPATRTVLAPSSEAVEILLSTKTGPQIYGKVMSSGDGVWLPEAQVTLLGPNPIQATAGAQGDYFLDFETPPGLRAFVFEASAKGYAATRETLSVEEFQGLRGGRRVDFSLRFLGDLTTLRGSVKDREGRGVGGAIIVCHCPSLGVRERSVTSALGEFKLRVPVAEDHRVMVHAQRGFKAFAKSPVKVSHEGAELEILLEAADRTE